MYERLGKGYCEESLTYYPIGDFIPGALGDVGILMLFSGILNIFMSGLTIFWIKRNEIEAQEEGVREETAKSVIFPIFVKVLWASAIINVYAGITMSLMPIRPISSNNSPSATNYALVRALKHCVMEGVAFLLMQKGCGSYAVKRAGCYTLVWGLLTLLLYYYSFKTGGLMYDVLDEFWNVAMLIFYAVLWLAPTTRLFRRPAAIMYAKFWTYYRIAVICCNLLFFFKDTDNLGACGYILTSMLFLAVAQPLICYWTLLQDSRWWQGLDIYQGAEGNTQEDIRTPLVGAEFALSSAQSLANTMDHMRVHGQVKMLNFASLKLDTKKLLGAGSFSKVYKGTYRGKECAIKLIYTADLTAEVIKRVAAEASILSSIRHPNIVNIFGVSVMPPSVCLILEICSFGSLSDIIRGYGYDWNLTHRAPLSLCHTDTMYLALGCARGLAAVHAYDSSMCHRDVKSFNFLVDHSFTVKIADLELGIASKPDQQPRHQTVTVKSEQDGVTHSLSSPQPIRKKRSESETHVLEDLLANWLAPEAIRYKDFEQYSDIFALGTVLWEVISGHLPFDHDPQPVIRQKILEGYRHPMPIQFRGSPIAGLITRCWSEDPHARPTAEEVVARIETMLREECYSLVSSIDYVPNTTALREYYELHYRNRQSSSRRQSSFLTQRNVLRNENNYSPYHESERDSDLSTNSRLWSSLTGGRGSSVSYSRLLPPTIVEETLTETHSVVSNSISNSQHCVSDIESDMGGFSRVESTATTVDLEKQLRIDPIAAGPQRGLSEFSSSSSSSHSPLPPAAMDVIKMVKAEPFWRQLENHGGAWAVVSVEAPHVVLHATASWHHMFQTASPAGVGTGQYPLDSIVSLSESYRAAMSATAEHSSPAFAASPSTHQQTTPFSRQGGSNSYVTSLSNRWNNEQSSAAVFAGMAEKREVHGVMSFHLAGRAGGWNTLNSMLVRGADDEGYNMMCTLHAYPVYPTTRTTPSIVIPQKGGTDKGFAPTSWMENSIFGSNRTTSSATGSLGSVSNLGVPSDSQFVDDRQSSSLISNISVFSEADSSPVENTFDLSALPDVVVPPAMPIPVSIKKQQHLPDKGNRRGKQKTAQYGPAYYAVLFSELKEQQVQIPEQSSSATAHHTPSMQQRIGDFLSSRSGGSSASNHSNNNHSGNNGKDSRTASRSSFSHNLSSTLSSLKSAVLPKSWSVNDMNPRRTNSFE